MLKFCYYKDNIYLKASINKCQQKMKDLILKNKLEQKGINFLEKCIQVKIKYIITSVVILIIKEGGKKSFLIKDIVNFSKDFNTEGQKLGNCSVCWKSRFIDEKDLNIIYNYYNMFNSNTFSFLTKKYLDIEISFYKWLYN